MAIPELIEMVPLEKPVVAEITVPGSKSLTNRALILAALAGGEITLRGALWSEDTQVMVESLQRLGFEIAVGADDREPGNRTLLVRGLGGRIPKAGTADRPLKLFVGNAGTAARFLAALVCLGQGVYRLQGTERMHERPQAGLFDALRQLGYRVDSPNNRLPADIFGTGPKPGATCTVDKEESSQFASAILLSLGIGRWELGLLQQGSEQEHYLDMTSKLMDSFPKQGGSFQVEPDASSASYFCAANWLVQPGSSIKIISFPISDWQIDSAFPNFLPLPAEISRRTQLGDSIMTAMVLAPFAAAPVKFTHLERLRVQECERVAAMRTELTKCGAEVVEEGQSLTIFPAAGKLRGAEIETCRDHRMAMCFAILGLKVAGLKIKNPACVKKTFPNFFQKLAARPPGGLGATILDARHRRPLTGEALFAD
ncbi:MAG: 3-phosphoshikimate 1-carboxyvinyltransferase [Verrucomicrobiota bacterium]